MIKLELTQRQCYEIANLLENSLEGSVLNPEEIRDLQKKTLDYIYDALNLDIARKKVKFDLNPWPTMMSVDTPVGAKVRFLGDLRMGSDYDQRKAKEVGLIRNQTYTVALIETAAWSTYVWLEEFPNMFFATVMFENVE